ncbi:MAG: TonB family protein [Myxococcaceae bacterium]|nr:TonB family protein [Myxococcaceae bacterium]
MASAPSNKILRVGVIQGGKIIEEHHLKHRADVTIGSDARNTIVVPASNLPASFAVFEHKANQYSLCFTEKMEGRVRVGDADVDFASLRSQAKKRGNVYVYPLTDAAKGKISLGEVTLLFQFVQPPPEPPRPELPPVVKGSFLAGMDRLFLGVLAASLVLHFSGATCIALRPRPVERELSLDQLDDRFARVLIPKKIEEPKPVEVADKGSETKEEKKPEKKEPKAETKPASTTASKADIQKKVASKGLLKILGSSGGAGSALEDVLGGGNISGDIGNALAGAGGVGVATSDMLGNNGARGGGTGTVAGIGDLGTSGGGNVDLGTHKDVVVKGRVRDSTPEVESSDVDPQAVARYVKGRLKAIQACYEKELKRNPSLKGRVVVRFTITPSGRVGTVEIEENSLNDAVANCIRTYIRGWVFPFKPEDEVPIAYPFVFSPASG